MQLTFLGSRGNHPATSVRHQRQSSLLIEAADQRLMLDCGSDWSSDVVSFDLDAILLTHAHIDHAGGIGPDIECPIFATAATWQALGRDDIQHKRIVSVDQVLDFGPLQLSFRPLAHSLRAPAVALLVTSPAGRICYAPDVAELPDGVLEGCGLYIGDGSTWDDQLLRQEAGKTCGHAPIPQQLDWCLKAGVSDVVFTHCGPQVVTESAAWQARLSARASSIGLCARFAHDGMLRELLPG